MLLTFYSHSNGFSQNGGYGSSNGYGGGGGYGGSYGGGGDKMSGLGAGLKEQNWGMRTPQRPGICADSRQTYLSSPSSKSPFTKRILECLPVLNVMSPSFAESKRSQ